MRTFVQKQNQPQQRESPDLSHSNNPASQPNHHPASTHNLSGKTEPLDERLTSPAASETLMDGLNATSSFRSGHNFNRIPLRPPIFRAAQPQPETNSPESEDERESDAREGAAASLVSPAAPPTPPLDSTCDAFIAPPLQRKQTVSSPGDPFEHEADEVADSVMRMNAPGAISSMPVAIQRKCAACVSKNEDEEAEKPTILTMPALSEQTRAPMDTGAAMRVVRQGGTPLPLDVRSYFEPRFGYDFSHVRLHLGSEAARGAHAVQARAYTVGHNIVFGAGEYAPATSEGKRLLAHELAHTLQQSSGGNIRRQPVQDQHADDPLIKRPVKVPPGITSGQQFLRYAETAIFKRVVNIGWSASTPGAQSILDDPSKHVGKVMVFEFRRSKLAELGVEGSTAEEKAATEGEYKTLEPDMREDVNQEIDRRYYESTGEQPGTKIKKGEQGKIAIWNSFKEQVLADKRKLDALPDTIKSLLGGSGNMTPGQFSTLVRIADKLSQLSAAELEDYKSKTTASTSDLSVLEASIDRYLAAKAEREKAREERENIATKLFGAEQLYEDYKNLGKEWARLNKEARDKQVQGDGRGASELRQKAKEIQEKEISDFKTKLSALGFASIQEFQKYLDDYEQAFLKETVSIALDVLQQYEHKLFEAEKQYSHDAAVDALLAQVQASEAPALIAEATQKIKQAKDLHEQGSFQTVQGNAHVGNKLSNESGAKMNEARDLTTKASNIVKNLPGQPLIKDDKFPRAALLSNDRETAKAAILAYIKDRRADITTSRDNLNKDPKVVYKLPRVMELSYEQQGITSGSILDRIITDRRREYIGDEVLWKSVLALIGIALTVLTAGGGAVAALAAVGAMGISGYQAIEEYREYEKNSAFAGAGLADDPSFAWVIVAVVGAFADMGAAVTAVQAVKAARVVETLDATSDLVQFEKSLSSIQELNQAARTNLLRAAEARLQAIKTLKAMVSPSGKLYATIPLLREMGYLTVAAFYSIKRGVYTFRAWLDELKAANVIADASKLAPEELKALKEAWDEGQQYTRSIRENVPELEQAMKEFRLETGIKRTLSPEGKVIGGTTGAAKTEVDGLSQTVFMEGSTKTKGASASQVRTNRRYSSPQSFGGTKNHAEQNILGDIADEIDKAKSFGPELRGQPKPGATGQIHLHVEQSVCSACRQGLNSEKPPGVVGQFSLEYPNITLVVTNAETAEVLFVRGGKFVKF